MSTLTLISRPALSRRLVTLTVVIVTLFGAGAVWAPRSDAGGLGCVADPQWATMKSAWATEVVLLTNAHRAALGLASLSHSPSLTAAAEWKAAHMANFGYMEHDDPAPPVGRTWDQRIEDCGYTHGMGENIAFGYKTPAAVVAGWIGSTGHRRNIENPDYRVIGVGAAVNSDGTPYWAQTFGTTAEEAAEPNRTSETARKTEPAQDTETVLPESGTTEPDMTDDRPWPRRLKPRRGRVCSFMGRCFR